MAGRVGRSVMVVFVRNVYMRSETKNKGAKVGVTNICPSVESDGIPGAPV